MKMNFKKQFSFYLIGILLFSLVISILIISNDNKEFSVLKKEEFNTKSIISQVKEFDNWFYEKIETTNRLSENIEFILKDKKNLDNLIEIFTNIADSSDDYLNLYFSSIDGVNYVSYGAVPGVEAFDRPWYKGAIRTKKVFMSIPYIDAITGEKVITFSKGIEDQNGKILGVFGIDLKYETFLGQLHKIAFENIDQIALVDSEGSILFENEIKNKYKYFIESKQYGKYIEDINSTIIYKQLTSIDYGVAIVINEDIKDNVSIETILNLFFFFSIYIILIVTIIAETTKFVNKPIEKLIKYSDEIQRGNYDLILNYDSDVEFNKLFESYHILGKNLSSNISKIEELNYEYEVKNEELINKNTELYSFLKNLKESEDKLSKFESKYNKLINNVSDYLWSFDDKGRITYVNESFLNAFGYLESELIEKHIDEIVNGGFNKLDFLIKKDFRDIEMSIFNSVRELNEVLTSTSRIFHQGKVVGIQCVSYDLEIQKNIQNNLTQKSRYLNIFENISIHILQSMNINELMENTLKDLDAVIDIKNSLLYLDSNINFEQVNYINLGRYYKNLDDVILKNILETCKTNCVLDSYKSEMIKKSFCSESDSLLGFKVEFEGELFGILVVAAHTRNEDLENTLTNVATKIAIFLGHNKLVENTRKEYLKILDSFVFAVEVNEIDEAGHSARVSKISEIIARQLNLGIKEIEEIKLCASLHDIGIIGSKLSESFVVDENHTLTGVEILKPMALSQEIYDGILYHHLNYDLSGYPQNSGVNSQPFYATIVQFANEVDGFIIDNDLNQGNLYKLFEFLDENSGTIISSEIYTAFNKAFNKERDLLLKILFN